MKLNKMRMFLLGGVAIFIVVMAFSGLAGAASQPASTIGYVDNERIVNELPDYKSFQNYVKDKQSQFNVYQSALLQQHNIDLKDLDEKAKKEKNGKSTEEQAAVDKKYSDLVQKKTDEIKAQLDQKRAEAMKMLNDQKKVIDDKVLKIISDIAKDKKLTVVIDKKAVYFGGADITDAVIEKAKKDAAGNTKK